MNPKNKGNTFERKIANLLSARFKPITLLEQAFRRNADSGSFFGGSNQRRKDTHDIAKATFGDIICPEAFRFVIECKHYKTPPTFGVVVKQECKQWDTWISQSQQDARNSGLKNLLIIKYNGIDEFVLVEDTLDIPLLFKYKSLNAYSLKSFLTQADDIFFDMKNIES